MKSLKMTARAFDELEVYELTKSTESKPIELERVVSRLHQCAALPPNAGTEASELEKYRFETAKAGIERRAEVGEAEEVNPLDDYEKLRQVRIAVFGSAPESKKF
jgi:hypothetical protein